MKIIISGGGTGGHLYPALSIAKILENKNDLVFIGSKRGIEENVLRNNNLFLEKHFLDISGFNKNLFKLIISIYKLIISIFKTNKIIKKHNPDYIFTTGGYASLSVAIVARIKKIKIICHEQNIKPGSVNNFIFKNAYKILVSYQETISHIKNKYHNKVIFSGNPRTNQAKLLSSKKTNKTNKTILIFSGSLGAYYFNQNIQNSYEFLNKKGYQIIHITGKNYKKINTKKYKNIKNIPYDDNILDTISKSSFIICRAGATTISEIIGLKKPSILVPSPYVKNLHQHDNAYFMESKKMALVCEEKEMNNKLEQKINELFLNEKQIISNINAYKVPKFDKIIINLFEKDI